MHADPNAIELSCDELMLSHCRDDSLSNRITGGGVSGTMSFPSPYARLTLVFPRL
jgi:hypothetical protein